MYSDYGFIFRIIPLMEGDPPLFYCLLQILVAFLPSLSYIYLHPPWSCHHHVSPLEWSVQGDVHRYFSTHTQYFTCRSKFIFAFSCEGRIKIYVKVNSNFRVKDFDKQNFLPLLRSPPCCNCFLQKICYLKCDKMWKRFTGINTRLMPHQYAFKCIIEPQYISL